MYSIVNKQTQTFRRNMVGKQKKKLSLKNFFIVFSHLHNNIPSYTVKTLHFILFYQQKKRKRDKLQQQQQQKKNTINMSEAL